MKKFTLKNLGKTVLALALALLAFGLLSCKKEKTDVRSLKDLVGKNHFR